MRKLAVLISLLAMTTDIVRAQEPTLVLQWGGRGFGPGLFRSPNGIAIDAADNLFVSDLENGRVQVFNTSGQFVRQWNVGGSGGIAVDTQANVYVPERNVSRVHRFHTNGDYLGDVPSAHFPGDVSVGVAGVVHVVGRCGVGTGVVKSTSAGAAWLGSVFCISGTGIALCATPTGDLFLSNGAYVQQFVSSSTDSTIQFVREWGGFGAADGQFKQAAGIAVDGDGRVYVADFLGHRIQVFSSTGQFLYKWGSMFEFSYPIDVALDGKGYIYVVDYGTNRILKYSLATVEVRPATWTQVRQMYR